MKATITITDLPGGGADMSTVFDPPLQTKAEPTAAGYLAVALLEHAAKLAKGNISSFEIEGE